MVNLQGNLCHDYEYCKKYFLKSFFNNVAVSKGEPIETRELTAKFTTDVIGDCIFGINMNSMSDEEGEFRKIGRKRVGNNLAHKIRRSTRDMPVWLAKIFKPLARDDKVINFFVNIVKNTMDYREKNKIRRNDFIDHLKDIKDNPEKVDDIGEYSCYLFICNLEF